MTMRTLLRALVLAALAALIVIPAASAHVTVNPREWEAGGFARFAVRVPNERPDASTTEVTVEFPDNVMSASFQPVPGWTRTVKMAQLDEPIEGEDGPIVGMLAVIHAIEDRYAPSAVAGLMPTQTSDRAEVWRLL